MSNKNKPRNLLVWFRWLVSIFNTLDGCTTSKRNPWRLRVISLSAALMGILLILMLYFKTFLVYPRLSRASSLPDVTQILNDYLQYIVDLYYITKYDKDASADYYHHYTVIDTFLNRQPEPDVQRRLAKLIGIFILIWLVNFAVHYATLWYEFYWQYPVIFIPFHLFVATKILTTLFLSAHTVRIECRLRIIGDLVDECFHTNDGWQNVDDLSKYASLTARVNRPDDVQNKIEHSKARNYNSNKIARLSNIYLTLTEQCEFVNNMYGVRILLLSLNLTIDMVRFINSLYRYVGGKVFNYLNHTAYSLAAASITRTLVCLVMLFSLVHHCERAYQQADRIVRLSDRVLIASTNAGDSVRASVSELRELAMSRPVSFTVARFFRLEYPALTAIAATVVSYSIILFQSM